MIRASDKIGDFFRARRKARGLTITELSKKSKVSHPYISQIETGKFKPSPDIIKKLADPLDTTYGFLMYVAGYVDIDALGLEDFVSGPVIIITAEKEYVGADAFEFHKKSEKDRIERKIERFMPRDYELTFVLEGDLPVRYNGHELSPEDRNRLSEILKLLFPNFQ